jgi:hypothetical protein
MMAGVDMVHVPYRGEAPALTDLIGGQVQGDIRTTLPTSIEHIRDSRLRALAVTTATRSLALPDVPTVAAQPAIRLHLLCVPPGSRKKREALVVNGITADGRKTTACTVCHGGDLRGLSPEPAS